jgi:hypothetical protein
MTRGGAYPSSVRSGLPAGGHGQTESVNERQCRGRGGGVVGDGRVGRGAETSGEPAAARTGFMARRPEEPPGGSPSVQSSAEAGSRPRSQGTQESGSGKSMPKDESHRAAAVTGATQPKQAADPRDQWGWVEPSVWTDRLLTRLEASEPTTTGGLRRGGCSVWSLAPALRVSLAQTSLTGEPDAGNPPVGFGGRGGAHPAIPTPIPPAVAADVNVRVPAGRAARDAAGWRGRSGALPSEGHRAKHPYSPTPSWNPMPPFLQSN